MAVNSTLNMTSLKTISIEAVSNMSLLDFLDNIKPLIIFIVAIVVYSLFIFKFYRFLARRDIFKMNHDYYADFEGHKHHLFRGLFYFLENLLFTPILVFFWFAVLAMLLLFLSKDNVPATIFLISAAVVASIRITSYYTENLSQDLSKMIPFALLGVFLVDVSFFSMDEVIARAYEIPTLFQYLIYYLLFLTALEYIMRVFYGIKIFFFGKKAEKIIEEQENSTERLLPKEEMEREAQEFVNLRND